MSELVAEIESSEGGMVVLGVAAGGDGALPANTLVEWSDDQLLLQAGSQWGPYAVVLRALAERPEPGTGWEDVVELAVAVDAEVGVGDVVDGPEETLDVAPGPYRLRVSARGRTESAARDEAFDDEGEEEPLEHYLLELWPAPPGAAEVVRQESRHARDLTDPPPSPPPSPEEQAGVRAAWALLADLRGEPGARRLGGDTAEVSWTVEVAGTPRRMFSRVGHAFGWPPARGGSGSPDLVAGARSLSDATFPAFDGAYRQYGTIETTVVEAQSPRRIVKTWNWLLPGPEGTRIDAWPRLLEQASTVTIAFVRSGGDADRTTIDLRHVGVPVEWVDDLRALWAWHVALFAARP